MTVFPEKEKDQTRGLVCALLVGDAMCSQEAIARWQDEETQRQLRLWVKGTFSSRVKRTQ